MVRRYLKLYKSFSILKEIGKDRARITIINLKNNKKLELSIDIGFFISNFK